MLNLFRRHVIACRYHGRRTGARCFQNPPCPIYSEGIDSNGKRQKPQAVIDPLTGTGVHDWSRAQEIVSDPPLPAELDERVLIRTAIDHFLNVRKTKSANLYTSNKRVMRLFLNFMEAEPRKYRFMVQVRFIDLTDFCSGWTLSCGSKINDLRCVCLFLRYCHRAEFTPNYLGEGLSRTLRWVSDAVQREPFTPEELEHIWTALPTLTQEPAKWRRRTADQTAAFVYLMRYTGMDVSTTMMLPKASIRGNQILTHRLKNGSEVWTVVPEWVAEMLANAPHDSEHYFFWNGEVYPAYGKKKWFWRLRRLLDFAGLPHRTPHNFRHHFAVEHLLHGTPIEDVARLLGHNDARITLQYYSAWIKRRQENLEQHQQRVWDSDPLNQRMTGNDLKVMPSSPSSKNPRKDPLTIATNKQQGK